MASINELCEQHGSDKCPKIAHSYAPFYDTIFNKDAKKVLELGAGSTDSMHFFVKDYKNCASLYVWRDFFPEAEIYGLDFNPLCDIKEDRIHIVIGDQTKTEDLQKLVDMAGSFDIIIDDCSHKIEDQIFSAKFLLPYLNEGGIYCIEDVREPERNFPLLKETFKNVETYEFKPRCNDCLAVIRK